MISSGISDNSGSWIEPPQFFEVLLADRPIIDVRAPAEFNGGALPHSVNLPILNDEERTLVGTCYKERGPSAAVKLGHGLVTGANREAKTRSWISFIQENPEAVLTCFRGGMRSGLTQEWLLAAGISIPRLRGGTKQARLLLMENINQFSGEYDFLVISGATGSGKTHFLKSCESFAAITDLEGLAHHKGSAFGKEEEPQPNQIDFENKLSLDLLKARQKINGTQGLFLVEDESRMIGSCTQPELFFEKLRQSPVIWLEVPLEDRVQNIFQDYILCTALAQGEGPAATRTMGLYLEALGRIQKRLGGLRYSEVLKDMERAQSELANLDLHRIWIRKLLIYYYDPLYSKSLEKRQPQVFFRGPPDEARAALIQASKAASLR